MTIRVNPYKSSSIQKAIDDLKALRKVVTQFPHEYMEAIAKRFDELLNINAPEEAKGLWDYRTKDTDRGVICIFEFAGELEFIEFGTGIVGKQNHDGINEEWADKLPPPYTGYESGHHINPITHEWRYWENGHYVVTTGQFARPFMYQSVQQLMTESVEIAKSVLRGEHGNGQG